MTRSVGRALVGGAVVATVIWVAVGFGSASGTRGSNTPSPRAVSALEATGGRVVGTLGAVGSRATVERPLASGPGVAGAGEVAAPTVVDRFHALVRSFRSRSSHELARSLGDATRSSLESSPMTHELKGVRDEFLGLVSARKDDGQSWRALGAELAETHEDLVGAWCRALDGEQEPRLRALLTTYVDFAQRDRRVLDALWSVLRRVVTEPDPFTEHEIVPVLASALVRHGEPPWRLWAEVLASDRERLLEQLFLWLCLFPAEQVEDLLVLGLDDARWTVRFGAMESVRYFGRRGEIDAPRFAARLRDVVVQDPDGGLLFVEAIGALGQGLPVLAPLVEEAVGDPDLDEVRLWSAATLAVHETPDDLLPVIADWLGGSHELRAAAVTALGALPGEEAETLLGDLLSCETDAERRRDILSAMVGRSARFLGAFAETLQSSGDPESRSLAVDGLAALGLGAGALPVDAAASLSRAAVADPSDEIREKALLALCLHPESTTDDLLRERFLEEDSDRVRILAGATLLLRGREDPDLSSWTRAAMQGESLVVRTALSGWERTLGDAAGLTALRDDLHGDARILRVVSEAIGPGAAKNPAALRARQLEVLLAALPDG